MMFIGIVGLTFLIVGWSIEALGNRGKKPTINPLFSMMYTLGSLFLTIYSFSLGNGIFLTLNAIVTLLSAYPLYQYWRMK